MGATRLTLTAALGRPTAAVPTGLFWKLVSVGIVAGAWEIAGRVPISFAFPTFADTVVAFGRLVASGELPRAYLSTLQPLVIGVVISAVAGVGLGVAMGLSRRLEWLTAPV